MPEDGGLLAVDSFFTTGIPRNTVLPVEHILLYDNARQVWPSLLQSYRAMSGHLDRLEEELVSAHQHYARAATLCGRALIEAEAEKHARRYRCRRRLHPLVRLLLKPYQERNP